MIFLPVQTHSLSFPFHFPCNFHDQQQCNTRISITLPNHTFSSPRSSRFLPLHRPATRHFKVMANARKENKVLEAGEVELLMATCITRTLSPALTLEHGLDQIDNAIRHLKSNPPFTTIGMYRFEVLVSPSTRALNWFSSQPESSTIYPQFFMSNEIENSTSVSFRLDTIRGVFGIGTAVSFKGSYSSASAHCASFKSYFSDYSTLVAAYGYMDLRSDPGFYGTGLSYFFVPQLELIELDGISILSMTLAWNDSSLCKFKEAVEANELSLYQARDYLWPRTGESDKKFINSTLTRPEVLTNDNAQMVALNALSVSERDLMHDPTEMKNGAHSHQFTVRFSPTITISCNMYPSNYVAKTSNAFQDYANINTLWASLIIEECSRLGLTYFCVAPGSRSSPLALAASAHPLTNCTVCYDERSLAFHAIGYSKGSHIPAVVITSSGTAVSNLLPAVVEASQDYVPLLLLTADRPPELQDAGANQSINQVNHFAPFVRHFYGLPVPTDIIPARMVLTSVDSAVYWATSSPCGPVHINCPFREPLDSSPKNWMLSCLKGLNSWMMSADPFTNYVNIQHTFPSNEAHGSLREIVNIMKGAKRGVLVLGAISSEDDIWAALLLAKHLLWPVVADILSGLRMRMYTSSFSEIRGNFVFVDHLDHTLLSDAVRDWAQADVFVQIGSRITSKRISQMLEDCFPCSYILVDKHPNRHDPSHIVTHRIQCTAAQFADHVLKASINGISSNWTSFLCALDTMVSREISFLIHQEQSLTEPYIAHVILEALNCGSAVFVGNSMPIRDADMYGSNWTNCTHSNDILLSSGLPCHGIRVSGNRGASGIDGLLSTAVGFAVGCKKRVLCVIGDVSFLHDTNGLALLKQRIPRKPITILVINNHGGAIFSFLPVAATTEKRVLEQFFYTSHDVSIQNLCLAHGIKHVHVNRKVDLQDALISAQHEALDSVIEVESCIEGNTSFHSCLKKFASHAADHSFNVLTKLSLSNSALRGSTYCTIQKLEYSLYRIRLCAPPTSARVTRDSTTFYREGFVLALFLKDGNAGFGEVAPLEIHKENLLDVEEQLRFLMHVIKGVNIEFMLPLLNGSFSSWIWNNLGIPPGYIFPSVRCGLEMAILNAIAATEGSSLLNILQPLTESEKQTSAVPPNVRICALLDVKGTPSEVAYVAGTLVKEGFTAIKLKVARRADPTEDADVIKEVRKIVGSQIQLRADANRKWIYEDAIRFGSSVKDCDLQYIEEPVRDGDDIVRFCEETGLPVALDETIDNIQGNPLKTLEKFSHAGIVAIVIKPSVVGGFENAALIARWAQQQGKMAVVSAAFESGLGLSAYIQFSCYLDLKSAEIYRLMNKEAPVPVAHGLGTYRWLTQDVITEPLSITRNPFNGFMEASSADAGRLLRNIRLDQNYIVSRNSEEKVRPYQLQVHSKGFSMSINVHEIGKDTNENVVVFLHGFLGTSEEWIPVMEAISGFSRCIAFDLPGHGKSKIEVDTVTEPAKEHIFSIEAVSDIICELLSSINAPKVTLVGYSMGARVALYMALRCVDMVEGAVVISGSPGLKDEPARNIRRMKDDSRACSLTSYGLKCFLDTWYAGDLWNSLRCHPNFKAIVTSRMRHNDVHGLAKVLSDLSVGRQPPLWEDLKHCKSPLLLIVGEKDDKFKRLAQEMCSTISQESRGNRKSTTCETVEIPGCGHAVHLENPLPVVKAIRSFLTNKRV
ncbi:protein PHYLLO, chloroplastic isoform X10 [Daucus carota subsp. sativus]|uniref:protein PHYLLO, chloroplastic isoform X10 n=1 Tax=Daucus carota subsp. sativus TaxID=79200 RepID=UPI0007F01888|nr:PREDICTED: protein PHYLLO, chloroplastic isoform X2 [Daucus carota subsp. sativus]